MGSPWLSKMFFSHAETWGFKQENLGFHLAKWGIYSGINEGFSHQNLKGQWELTYQNGGFIVDRY